MMHGMKDDIKVDINKQLSFFCESTWTDFGSGTKADNVKTEDTNE